MSVCAEMAGVRPEQSIVLLTRWRNMTSCAEKYFVREFERKDNSVLKIHQCEIGDVGCVVWDAAIVLASYLEVIKESKETFWEGTRVVELGAGTGLVGLQAGCLGAKVTVTDLPELIPLLEKNITENSHLLKGIVSATSLTWGEEPIKDSLHNPDVILIADCVYYEEAVQALISTIRKLAGPQTVVLCCYEERELGNKEELQRRFFQLIGETFEIDEIPSSQQDPVYQSDDIHLFRFKTRK